jgi:Type II secretion system (T2SS), protein F
VSAIVPGGPGQLPVDGTALVAAVFAAALAVLSAPAGRPRPAERLVGLVGRVDPPHEPAEPMDGRSPPVALPIEVVLDLVAAALDAGLPPPAAVDEAFRAIGGPPPAPVRAAIRAMGAGVPAGRAWARADPQYAPLARALVLAELSGARVGPLVRAAAQDRRAARARAAQVAARRLGVRLVLPLGLTTLPSFMLLGVLPVVLGLAGSVLTGR